MLKFLGILSGGILTSFFLFPFSFFGLPGNTKIYLAGAGLVICLFYLMRKGKANEIPENLLVLLMVCSLVSLVALLSITYNQTEDTSYVSYVVSAAVWMSAAFTTCLFIRLVHGRIDVPLVCNYLIAVGVFQCVAALLIAFVPGIQLFVDSYVSQGQDILKELNRLYGIGAALDVAGSRFACILVGITFLLHYKGSGMKSGTIWLYLLSYLIIAVIGNMIARTTSIGIVISVFALLLSLFFRSQDTVGIRILAPLVAVFFIGAVSILSLYNNPQFQDLLHFGFEGIFNYFELGEYQVSSTEKLKTMIVFPEELETWIIGDGYFMNSRYDPNYLGKTTDQGFYMGTDIGYLRFIFYFGVIGLIAISAVMIYTAAACARQLPDCGFLFLLIALVGFVVWLKVSTDVFLVLVLFLCVADMQPEAQDVRENEKVSDETFLDV